MLVPLVARWSEGLWRKARHCLVAGRVRGELRGELPVRKENLTPGHPQGTRAVTKSGQGLASGEKGPEEVAFGKAEASGTRQ